MTARTTMRAFLASAAVLGFLASNPVRAEHFDIKLLAVGPDGVTQEAYADESPPGGGLNPRPVLKARAGDRSRSRNPPSSFPAEGPFCWPQPGRFSGSGIILARSLPTPKGSGCDRVRPPLQLRGSGGFAPPSLTRLMSSRALARVCERCQGT